MYKNPLTLRRTANVAAPKVTAIVVVRNEAAKLGDCLASLAWCDQIIAVDMESSDGSAEVARRYTPNVLSHPRSPIVEPVRQFATQYAQNDWLLFMDPDERFPAALVRDLHEAIADHPRAGTIRLPWQFYFKGRPLEGTVWGGPSRTKRSVVHRRRVRFSPLSHVGTIHQEEFDDLTIPRTPQNAIIHLWMDSYAALVEKHWRYVLSEGEARHGMGRRASLHMLTIEPLLAFKASYRDAGGWRLGIKGLLLSGLYAAFQFGGGISLVIYQWKHRSASSAVVAATETAPATTIAAEAVPAGAEPGAQASTKAEAELKRAA